MMTSETQKAFIHSEVQMLTTLGALGRASVYASKDVPDCDRQGVRKTIKECVVRMGCDYTRIVPEKRHLHRIAELAETVTSKHTSVLRDGRFRVGIAQKALNLYLKYRWCLGFIEEPPHCPIDAVVLAEVPAKDRVAWTKVDSMEDYMKCIRALRSVAGGLSLAQWELGVWDSKR